MGRFKIENPEPKLRLMIQDYGRMFSGYYLRFLVSCLAVLAALFVAWCFLPPAVSPEHPILRLATFLSAYVLIVGCPLIALCIASPFLARFVLPLIVLILEMARALLECVQFLIDRLLVQEMTRSWFYPTPIEAD